MDPTVLLLTFLCIAAAFLFGQKIALPPPPPHGSPSESVLLNEFKSLFSELSQTLKQNEKSKKKSRRKNLEDEDDDEESENDFGANQKANKRKFLRNHSHSVAVTSDQNESLFNSMSLSPSLIASSSPNPLNNPLPSVNNNLLTNPGNLDLYSNYPPSLASSNNLQDVRQTLTVLSQRNRLLQRQLALSEFSNVIEVDDKYRSKLTPSEIETIRAIFNLFDTANTGTIRSENLKALHLKLGEPLTDEEAANALADLDIDGTGEVTFNKFVYWWYESHKGGKRTNAYTSRFKLLHAKLSDPNFNCDKVITQDSGTIYTLEYRMGFYYKSGGGGLKQISPWHDIPLYRLGSGSDKNGLYNMIVEIPKWTRAKFEIATGEPFNPIKQDTKNGALRYYKHGDMMFNYGLFPQTWEDPAYSPSDTKCPGDNDPIDAIEVGCKQLKTGSVVAVKLLGVLALIDDGETDWKCIVISIDDPLAALLNDIDDVETHLPGAIHAIREYFRDYKNYAGGKQNYYGLREQAMPRDYAVKVVDQTHHHWMTLHLERKQHTVSKEQAAQNANTNSEAAPKTS